jgi:hypothetical protein
LELVVVDPVAGVAVERGPGGVDGGAGVGPGSFLGDRRDLADIRRVLPFELPAAGGLALLTIYDERTVQGSKRVSASAMGGAPL